MKVSVKKMRNKIGNFVACPFHSKQKERTGKLNVFPIRSAFTIKRGVGNAFFALIF
jgi:hypothetical protein